MVLAPVHGDREDPIPGVDSELIASHIALGDASTFELASDLDDAARRVAAAARPGDWVFTVGSGTVTGAASAILDLLKQSHGGA